jgi:hypothetical protein
VEVYVVPGPSEIYFGGRLVPGGFEYLNRSLRNLSFLNPNCEFKVKVAHSTYHGPIGYLSEYQNLSVEILLLDQKNISDLEFLDPVLQHGTILNYALGKIPPESRYVIILDPDCYVVEPNIVSSLIKKMQDDSIGIAGLPYPAWYPKEYSWESPQIYFSVFDRNLIDPIKIDFRSGEAMNVIDDKSVIPNVGNCFRVIWKLRRVLFKFGIIHPRSTIDCIILNKLSSLEKRPRINPCDTGWRILEYIKMNQTRTLVCPYIVIGDVRILGLNRKSLLEKNPDLLPIKNHLGWYFLNHAVIETQDIGTQGLIPRLINGFIGESEVYEDKWPIKSLFSSLEITNQDQLWALRESIPSADYYGFAGKVSFFHIGSKGKEQGLNQLENLDAIFDLLIQSKV